MSTQVGGIILPNGPLMIGAGVCKTPAQTIEWLKLMPVESGSYTPAQRDGNSGRVLYPETIEEFLALGSGINSYNMPNIGYVAAAVELASYQGVQPLLVSVAGFSVADYIFGVETFSALDSVSAIVFNFGCPNSGHGEIMSFTPLDVTELMAQLSQREQLKPIWLKFSPYSNPAELKRMAQLINHYPNIVRAVVTCNTFANAYAGPDTIDPNNGMGGLSGRAMKKIALGQVRQFRQHLVPQIDVVGVGGVTTGNDVVDLLNAGAQAVQCVSLAHWAGNPDVFHTHLLEPATATRFLEMMNNHI